MKYNETEKDGSNYNMNKYGYKEEPEWQETGDTGAEEIGLGS